MEQLICASLSHTHYWYEVGMLKVPAIINGESSLIEGCFMLILLFVRVKTRQTTTGLATAYSTGYVLSIRDFRNKYIYFVSSIP